MPLITSVRISFLTLLSSLPSSSSPSSLPFSSVFLPGNLPLLYHGHTFGIICSLHSCLSFSLSTTKVIALCGLDSKSSTTPLQLVLQGLFDTLLCFFGDKLQSFDISQLLLQLPLLLIQFFYGSRFHPQSPFPLSTLPPSRFPSWMEGLALLGLLPVNSLLQPEPEAPYFLPPTALPASTLLDLVFLSFGPPIQAFVNLAIHPPLTNHLTGIGPPEAQKSIYQGTFRSRSPDIPSSTNFALPIASRRALECSADMNLVRPP